MIVMSHEEWYWFIRITEMLKTKYESITPTMFAEATNTPVEKVYIVIHNMIEQNLIQFKEDEETIEILDLGWVAYKSQKSELDSLKRMIDNG